MRKQQARKRFVTFRESPMPVVDPVRVSDQRSQRVSEPGAKCRAVFGAFYTHKQVRIDNYSNKGLILYIKAPV